MSGFTVCCHPTVIYRSVCPVQPAADTAPPLVQWRANALRRWPGIGPALTGGVAAGFIRTNRTQQALDSGHSGAIPVSSEGDSPSATSGAIISCLQTAPDCRVALQRQTAVTAYFSSKQLGLLLFAFVWQGRGSALQCYVMLYEYLF